MKLFHHALLHTLTQGGSMPGSVVCTEAMSRAAVTQQPAMRPALAVPNLAGLWSPGQSTHQTRVAFQGKTALCRITVGPSAKPFAGGTNTVYLKPKLRAIPCCCPRKGAPEGGREGGRSAVLSWLLAAGSCCPIPVPNAGWRIQNCWQMSRTYRAGLWVGRDCSQRL